MELTMCGSRLLRNFFALSAVAAFPGMLYATNALTLTPGSVALTCAKGSATCAASVSVALSDGAGPDYFLVNPASVPYWLQVSLMNGLATSTPQNMIFTPSAAWVNLSVGVYTAVVSITGTAITTATVPVILQITDTAPGLSVQPADPYTVNWQSGQPYPVLNLTVYSTSTVPVKFTATMTCTTTNLGVSNWLSPYSVDSIAYGWGTTIPLSVDASAYSQAQAGETLAGTVTIAYGTSSTKVVHVNVVVSAPPAVISSLAPVSVPVLTGITAAGAVTIAVNGSNFVQNQIQTTKVMTGQGTNVTVCTACTVHVLNSQNMTVAIPYDSTGVPFRAAGSLTIGVANGATNTPQSTKTLNITAAPIINGIASASTLMAPAPGGANAYPTVAPYDVISIFGSNFCPASVSACSTPIVATLDPYFRYPTYLSPDAGTHKLAVLFSRIATIGAVWANVPGYLLYASNNQINVVVPSAILNQLGSGTVKVVVSFDTSATAPATANSSSGYLLNVAAVDPGVFTLDSSGSGAILDASTFILNTESSPATGGSSTVAIYMTGLGIPTSIGSDAPQSSANPPTTCISTTGAAGNGSTAPTGYMGAVNTSVAGGGFIPLTGYTPPGTAWTSIDGAIIRSALLSTNVSPPCFGGVVANLPTVTIGGQAATVSYAGFVADSIVGLYQVNVAVPAAGSGTAVQYPVIVTMGSVVAPTVQMWVQ
jgi:uncharacterized protein (TIGR03437 family)